MLASDTPKVVNEPIGCLGHVQDFRITIHLNPRAIPLVGEDNDRCARIPGSIPRFASSRIGGDNDPPVSIYSSCDRRHLRSPIRTGRCEQHPVTRSDEVEEVVAVDGR